MSSLTIASRFNGPPGSGNGGVVAGRISKMVEDAAAAPRRAVQVTLRRPPPLERPLRTAWDGARVQVFDGELLIAEAEPIEATALGAAVAPVEPAAAAEAMTRFAGRADHPFATCFVCGTERDPDDGLRQFAGAVDPAVPHRTAAVWLARADQSERATGAGARDTIAPEMVWAALDCPGGWALDLPGRPAVLGRMSALVSDVPAVGESCVIVGQLDRRDGRKAYTRTTAYGADGRELGRAAALWIEIAPPSK